MKVLLNLTEIKGNRNSLDIINKTAKACQPQIIRKAREESEAPGLDTRAYNARKTRRT